MTSRPKRPTEDTSSGEDAARTDTGTPSGPGKVDTGKVDTGKVGTGKVGTGSASKGEARDRGAYARRDNRDTTRPSAESQERADRRRAREDERAKVSRSRRRAGTIAAAVVAVVLAGFAVVYFSPVLTVRTIDVRGAVSVSEDEVIADLAVPMGEKLVRVDTGAAARRVASIPSLASVRVQRMYPSTIRVTVTERIPVVFVDRPDGTHLLDADAVDFAVAPPPPGVIRLVTDNPVTGDPPTESALAVLDSLPEPLRVQVGEIRAGSASDVSVILFDGRTVVWGDRDRSERKSAVALALLSQPGQILDVSSPDLPTTK
ncbi:MAG: FtsQ-type POTRA domain-containing protein [Rhodococcus fascians]